MDSKTINVRTQGLSEEVIVFTPGLTVERNYVFDGGFVNPVAYFGVGLAGVGTELKQGQINAFDGSMVVHFADGHTVEAFHVDGSLQWNTAYNSPAIPDLRNSTCKLTLTLRPNAKSVQAKTQFSAQF